jgi:GDP-mannose 6-dehydrogenase
MDTKLNLSSYYLKPGFSYGGSCLPKDLRALETLAHDNYVECPVLSNISRSNELQKQLVLDKLLQINKSNIGFLGLSFKSGTDDLRESPIVDIIERLIGKGFNVTIYDKNVNLAKLMGANRDYILNRIPLISQFLTDDQQSFVEKSDVIVIVNKDKTCSSIIKEIPRNILVYDLVNFDSVSETHDNYEGLAW